MFKFLYKGRFDCLISKETFETYVENLFHSMKSRFNVKWTPKQFLVVMEVDPKRRQGWGGNNWYDKQTNTVTLQLQLFGFPKKDQTFNILQRLFGDTLTHEMLHCFIPPVEGNSCWTEGVTEFMTFWFHDTTDENLARTIREYNEITDEDYKRHKHGYVAGFKKMNALYADKTVMVSMLKVIRDFNKTPETKRRVYTKSDIIEYDGRFRTFFTGLCGHVPHAL